jgi:hypothetical protein
VGCFSCSVYVFVIVWLIPHPTVILTSFGSMECNVMLCYVGSVAEAQSVSCEVRTGYLYSRRGTFFTSDRLYCISFLRFLSLFARATDNILLKSVWVERDERVCAHSNTGMWSWLCSILIGYSQNESRSFTNHSRSSRVSAHACALTPQEVSLHGEKSCLQLCSYDLTEK